MHIRQRKRMFVLQAAACSVLAALSSLSTAYAGQIAGTYVVTYQRVCVISPTRATSTPAYFSYNTANGINGFVQVPNGTGYPDSVNQTYRTYQTGKYRIKINPVTAATIVDNGVFHSVPFSNGWLQAQQVPVVANFGTFAGNGTFVEVDPTVLDVNMQTTSLDGDGVTRTLSTNNRNRLRTTDGGATYFSVPGPGSIRLMQNLNTGLYNDQHCSGTLEGHRITTSYE